MELENDHFYHIEFTHIPEQEPTIALYLSHLSDPWVIAGYPEDFSDDEVTVLAKVPKYNRSTI